MRAAGDAFEQRACAELEVAGLRLLARNYTSRYGELDLIMSHGGTVVFVEVRYRKNSGYGDAAASVTAAKQGKLILAAQHWLAAHPRYRRSPCRFDVVSYDGPAENAQMHWLRDAFEVS